MDFVTKNGGVVTTTPPLLEMQNITKSFGTLIANNDVSISLNRGEILGLLGENGAGKSTLMKILYGLYSMDHGKILIEGIERRIKSPQEAVQLGIGMVHQEFMQVPTVTVAENIMLGAETGSFWHYDSKEAAKRVNALAKKFGLVVNPNKKVSDLSVGQRQRVEILKALYREARILILDEPTAVLTPQEVEELFKVLRVFVEQGLSIIFITHKLGEVLKVCDRVTILRDGKAIDTVNAKTTGKSQLAKMMVGREVVLRINRGEREPGDVLLAAKDLSYDAITAQVPIKNVNLRVREGEIVGIAGVDGNGQKELGELLAGIRLPTGGAITLRNMDITRLGASKRYDLGISFVPEDRKHTGLVGPMTISENIALRKYRSAPIASKGLLNLTAMNQYASRLVNEFDVRPRRIDNLALRLSGGNQQKLILARELSVEPTVIIASQPTRGLDVGAIEFVHNLLMEERDRGAAIVLISFELDEIRSLADRIIVLFHGAIIGEVNNSDATDEMIGLWMAGIKDLHSPLIDLEVGE